MRDWYGPDAATFGDRLAAARDAAGMSQQDLAELLGVRIATLRSWENDRSEPRANRLSMVSGLLGVSMIWLISGEGEGIAPPTGKPQADTLPAEDILRDLRELRAQMSSQLDRISRIERLLVSATGSTDDE